MNGFVILLSMIFGTALIIGSVQYVAADHLEPGKGIFADEGVAYIIETKGSPYQVYLQSVIRNGDGQLINVTESTAVGAYVPHEITDHTFNTFMGKKEIVTIGNIKYEKVQYTHTPSLEYRFVALYPIYTQTPFSFDTDRD